MVEPLPRCGVTPGPTDHHQVASRRQQHPKPVCTSQVREPAHVGDRRLLLTNRRKRPMLGVVGDRLYPSVNAPAGDIGSEPCVALVDQGGSGARHAPRLDLIRRWVPQGVDATVIEESTQARMTSHQPVDVRAGQHFEQVLRREGGSRRGGCNRRGAQCGGEDAGDARCHRRDGSLSQRLSSRQAEISRRPRRPATSY